MGHPVARSLMIVLCAMAFAGWAAPAMAGGTSENLILVVNADSASSKKIANYYIKWRKIPAENVVYLSGIPSADRMPVDRFRELILKPIIATVQKRKLAAQVDYIVYSTDFPTRILIDTDIAVHPDKKRITNNRQLRNQLSITSATYFLQSVMQKKLGYLSLSANWYMRASTNNIFRTTLMGPDQEKYNAALIALKNGEYDKGVNGFQALTEKYRDNYLIWYQVARCYAMQEKAAEAALAMNHAIRHGWQFRDYVDSDSNFDSIRNNPAFVRILDSMASEPFDYLPTEGFRSRYAWQPNGIRAAGTHTGRKYFLSTMLATSGGGGTTDEQTLSYLKAAFEADATDPKGTFYFAQTNDVRTKTRKPHFQTAIDALARSGQKAEIVNSILPSNKQDIMGCSIGISKFSWPKAKSKILPGAICENLTSYGGLMSATNKQTNLSEFMRYGAAGSSGTVIEPYAIQAKFPHPLIHAHYANGASLAEAFYQSVHGPFQLLIVGDALCRPFAKPQKFTVKGLKAGEEVKGKLELEIIPASDQDSFSHFELFTDGVFRANLSVGRKVVFDSAKMSDGYHEIRVVGVADTRVETRSRAIIPFTVNNKGTAVGLIAKAAARRMGQSYDIEVSAKDATWIRVYQNGRELAKVEGAAGRLSVDADMLGQGPTALYAIAEIKNKRYRSLPLELQTN